MKSATWPVLICLLALAAAAQEPKQRGENKERSAVQTRCLQECAWLRAEPEKYNQEKIKKLEQACVDPARVDKALQAKPPAGWGESKQQAIEVCLPQGERAFIEDLRCRGGEAPDYHRSGNVGSRNPFPENGKIDMKKLLDVTAELQPGEIDLHIIDRYEVKCADGVKVLFFDMYHCGTPKPWQAPAGFSRPLR